LTADRICKAKYPENDGEGARLHGGRWNHKGTAMIYCGQTASLAALEVLANSAGLPSKMVIIQAQIPDILRIKKLEKADLPGDWNRAVPSDSTTRPLSAVLAGASSGSADGLRQDKLRSLFANIRFLTTQ
jgi:RES domain-containing protein